MKLFGQKRPDLFFTQAEVEGLGDELLDGRIDLPAPGFELEHGALVRDEAAEAVPGLDEAVPLEQLVDLRDGERVDAELGGEVAHGGKLGAAGELPGEDALLQLLLELDVERDPAVRVEEIRADI